MSNKANVERGDFVPDGADTSKKGLFGNFNSYIEQRTPLMVVCLRGKGDAMADIIKILFKYGCNVFATNEYGYTAIHHAARRYGEYPKSIEIIYNHLINKENPKYDKDKIDKFLNQQCNDVPGATAYHLAVKNKKWKIVQILLKLCKVNCEIQDKDGKKARDMLPDDSKWDEKRKWLMDLEAKYCNSNSQGTTVSESIVNSVKDNQ